MEKFEVFEIESKNGLAQLVELKKLGLPVIPKIELERKGIGPKAKHNMGKLVKLFSETDQNDIVEQLGKAKSYTFNIDSNEIVLNEEDFVIEFDVKPDYQFSNRGNFLVILSVIRNQEMMAKGLVKDLARRLQTLRKERGYNPTDILNRASILDLDQESFELIKTRMDEISFLVRVKEVNFEESCKEYKNDDIDGQKIR